MDWTNLMPLIVAILVAIGVPFAAWSLRKTGRSKAEEFAQHLKEIGVKASLLAEGADEGSKPRKRFWGQRAVGRIKVEEGNIDSIDVIGVASQYGVNYYLDYLVARPTFTTATKRKKTTMSTKKTSLFRGRVVDVQWRGDATLAPRLNNDYGLKGLLLQADLSAIKGGSISIHPEPKREHARIRTGYGLIDASLYEALDAVAGHIKSWY